MGVEAAGSFRSLRCVCVALRLERSSLLAIDALAHPNTRQLPIRVAQLVVDDGVCVTKRGRELAQHVTTRAFIEHVTGRPVTRLRALPAAEPEPEQALAAAQAIQPVRTPTPEPERPARRRRRRRARRIRAVEASATPEPMRVQASGRVQEPLSPVRPVQAPLNRASTDISACTYPGRPQRGAGSRGLHRPGAHAHHGA